MSLKKGDTSFILILTVLTFNICCSACNKELVSYRQVEQKTLGVCSYPYDLNLTKFEECKVLSDAYADFFISIEEKLSNGNILNDKELEEIVFNSFKNIDFTTKTLFPTDSSLWSINKEQNKALAQIRDYFAFCNGNIAEACMISSSLICCFNENEQYPLCLFVSIASAVNDIFDSYITKTAWEDFWFNLTTSLPAQIWGTAIGAAIGGLGGAAAGFALGSIAGAATGAIIMSHGGAKMIISGIVVDENGGGLPGASVRQVATNNCTVTGADGLFTIEVSTGSTLEISLLGYKTATINTSDVAVVNMILEEDDCL